MVPQMTSIKAIDVKEGRKELFPISVNRKPVEVGEPLITGLEIKESAIKQGVAIELDFRLAKVDVDGKHRIVGGSEKVDVLEFKTFFATAGDDNS